MPIREQSTLTPPQADNTITLGFPKLGLFNLPGAEKAGRIAVVDIGIPTQLVEAIQPELLTPGLISLFCPGGHRSHIKALLARSWPSPVLRIISARLIWPAPALSASGGV